jgi:hypothetical protein
LISADIQNFYPSIYTHSIPWAIHGKATAKQRMGDPHLYGNRLDKSTAGCQEGQTVGVAIGPDTSLIVAECLLAAVERELTITFPKLNGYRWI